MLLEQQIAALLNHEVASLDRLQDVLKQEYDALLSADIEAIERATSGKNLALKTQADATQARQRLTISSSFSGTEEGLQQLLASCDNREQLVPLYSRLVSLAKQCHASNRTNGRLIMQKQQQTLGALNIIRQTNSDAATYSGQGKTMATGATRTLGKA